MNGEKLMDHIGEIDDALIIEAEEEIVTAPGFATLSKKVRRVPWRIVSLAASVVLLTVVALSLARLYSPYLLHNGADESAAALVPTATPMPEAAAAGDSDDFSLHDEVGIPWTDDRFGGSTDAGQQMPPGVAAAPPADGVGGAEMPLPLPQPSIPADAAWDNATQESEAAHEAFHVSGLPMLPFNDFIVDGLGMQAFYAVDIRELAGNPPPITDMELETLPVFRNPMTMDWPGSVFLPVDTPDTDAMLKEIARVAAIMGLSMDDADEITYLTIDYRFMGHPPLCEDRIREGWDRSSPISATVTWGEISITAPNTNVPHTMRIYLPVGSFQLPEGIDAPFDFDFASYATNEQILAMVAQLMEHFAHVVEMESPAIDVVISYSHPEEGFVRSISWHGLAAYENAGSYVSRILGYNFHRVNFVPNSPPSLWATQQFYRRDRIDITRPDFMLSQKIGDYPIISIEEARRQLVHGNYISTVYVDRPPAEEFIAHVDLVYLTHWQEIFMPFYRFKVEIPHWGWYGREVHQRQIEEYGIQLYGWYFVPAVQCEFLMNWNPVIMHFQ